MAFRRTLALVAVLTVFLTACSSEPTAATPSPTPTLEPYRTSTPPPKASAVPLQQSGTPEDLLPSPTPFVHSVQEGETLLDIALEYGLSLDQLLAANPGVDPHILSIGQELSIPGPEGELSQVLLPTSTPLPVATSEVVCQRAPSGLLWCIVTAVNDLSMAVEGLTARVTLVDQDGMALASQLAYAPLNRLPVGGEMPLMTSFDRSLPDPAGVSVDLLSAVGSGSAEGRYVPVRLENVSRQRLAGGRRWRVEGRAELRAEELPDQARLSILVVGLDDEGRIVGFTKWEPREVNPSEALDFEIYVQSLGAPIEEVDLLAEAAPVADG